MKLRRREFDEMDRCYAVSHTYIDGVRRVIFAAEGPDPCYMYSGDNFVRSTVWTEPGGCSDMLFLPGRERDFLATQRFMPGFQSQDAELRWGHFNEKEEWEHKVILKLPFLHRFGVIRKDGVNHILLATLCGSKKDREDWSDPGAVYVGILPEDLNQPLAIKPIKTRLFHNHGFCITRLDGKDCIITTSDEGAFVFTPPDTPEGDWGVEQLMDWGISDIAVVDIDGDGEPEFVTIEPFHGTKFLIHKRINGRFQVIYRCPYEREFGHVVWAGMLRGIPTVLGAHRRPEKDFFYVQVDTKNPLTFKTVMIDRDGGPSNIDVIHEEDYDILVVPQREAKPAYGSIYYVTDE